MTTLLWQQSRNGVSIMRKDIPTWSELISRPLGNTLWKTIPDLFTGQKIHLQQQQWLQRILNRQTNDFSIRLHNLFHSILSPIQLKDLLNDILKGLHVIFFKGKHWKGQYIPSQWKWYHRHGYWATRRKKLSFTRFVPGRYHEVMGPGKKGLQEWQDPSYYKSLNRSNRFW